MGVTRVADREVDLSPTAEAGASGFTEVLVSVTDIDRACRPFIPTGGNEGSLELISMPELEGRDFAAQCVAPNVGYLALRFPADDARRLAAQIRSRGGVLYSEPAVMELAPFGRVVCFGIRSPDGALPEFLSAP